MGCVEVDPLAPVIVVIPAFATGSLGVGRPRSATGSGVGVRASVRARVDPSADVDVRSTVYVGVGDAHQVRT